ncbi:hypothetical protein [Alteribacter aurantiacus]|uniref:hypothetical protein n=1 Tax=Alteribacter aurantiacus TaxID=254410 RepID=UPI0004040E7D|nr:hypothetical protein [Alteribacter aurantiacus]
MKELLRPIPMWAFKVVIGIFVGLMVLNSIYQYMQTGETGADAFVHWYLFVPLMIVLFLASVKEKEKKE